MHANQESQLKKLGIIAGTGMAPELLAQRLEQSGIQPCIVALDGITPPELFQNRRHILTPIGMAGRMMDWFKENGVTEIVMSGALRRPDWLKIKADPRGLKIIARILLRRGMGDDALLRTLRSELESEGFRLRGIQEFVPELLAPSGLLTEAALLQEDSETIELGWNAAKEHGRKDRGQSVVVQQETVLGLEGDDGTRSLMQKAASIKSHGRGPILVKVCKPQQDKALDMPTIGPETVETARASGFCGIVVEAGETLILEREKVITLCNRYGIFLLGKI